jgi:hypothetical protein
MPARLRRTGFLRRRKWGDTEPPEFFKLTPAVGLEEVLVEFSDWNAGRITDPASGEEIMGLEIVAVEPDSAVLLKSNGRISHVKIGELYYKFKGVRHPLGGSTDWFIECSGSGDKKAT